MKKRTKGIACLCLTATLSLALFAGQMAAIYADESAKSVSGKSNVAFKDVTGEVDLSGIQQQNFNSSVMEAQPSAGYETRTVIVSLKGSSIAELSADETAAEYLSTSAGSRAAREIEKSQTEFLRQLTEKGIKYTVKNTYSTVDNAVAIEINTKYVSEIKKMSCVESAVISRTYAVPQTVESASQSATINETTVYKTGIYDSSEFLDTYSGKGMVVAILDTGLDYTHPAFNNMPEGEVSMTYSDVVGLLAENNLAAQSKQRGDLSADDVYVSAKVPFAYDYADNDPDVYPSYSTHGTHVAGIVAGLDENGYTDKDGNHIDETFIGVAPDAQLVICKVFTDDLEDDSIGGAETEDILAALEDCVLLDVDVINMSLGTTAGFSTTDDGDSEGDYMNAVYESIKTKGISLIAAASNDYSSGYGGTFGTNLASNPDSGTVGSPSTYASALSVASISGQMSKYLLANEGSATNETSIFYTESSDENSVEYDFAKLMLTDPATGEVKTSGEFEYVVVPGIGQAADYTSTIRNLFNEKPGQRIALIKRGTTTFQEKIEIAMAMGAKAAIVYNNVSGTIRMSLGEIEDPIPAISVTMDAGNALIAGARESASGRVGKIKIDTSLLAGPFMSDFSSWGSTPDLKIKPEITAHGGEITSAVPGGYDEYSGTSMASPNMAGVMALVRSYVEDQFDGYDKTTKVQTTRLVNQLMMSTATTVYDEEGLPYSPRKQGAGLGSLKNALTTQALIYTENEENDYRPKYELGDDKNKNGEYTVNFVVKNFGDTALSFQTQSIFMTETLASDKLAVAEKAHLLTDIAPEWKVDGAAANGNVTVAAGSEAKVSVTLKLSDAEKKYIDDSFKNGMFVEGFLKLLSAEGSEQCDLVIPFMGFYGDWEASPMLDYDCFEVSAFEQDSSYTDEDRPRESIWATQAYTEYYNQTYVLPMGSYLYTLPDDADKMYTNVDYCAVSRYNEYVSEDGFGNYMTSTAIKAVYAGLLRNARLVTYTLTNAETGELLKQDVINRVGKAYASGGSARPAYMELDIDPELYGLTANGKYTMDFQFFFNEDSAASEENTFSFTFYVDYDAPVLQDARIRYYDYKDGNKDKQRIYLDLDIYDNHYAQSVMLCYLDKEGDQNVIKMATEYVTPVRNAVKNGVTTVSIEITDIYDEYKDKLYVQIDDYALNHGTYALDLTAASSGVLPDTFDLAEGESDITLGVYDTHKVALEYEGSANLSNFTWSSSNRSVAQVKNGEIVGLKPGSAKISVRNGNGVTKTINVTVVEGTKTLTTPSISFGPILLSDESVAKAQGVVKVNANQDFTLSVITDPWYYPLANLNLRWTSTNPDVATVDENGNVSCVKKGTAIIMANIVNNGVVTSYSTSVTLSVQDEFRVSNYTLYEYTGRSTRVVIPTDKNIMYIGAEAFKDNDYIEEIIIPKSVMQINERAFFNCTALKRVYFIQEDAMEIADADLTLINRRAFYGCTALELVDLSNVKTISVGKECFAECTALKEIRKITNIGTMYDGAFSGCISLKSVDLSGLHVSGQNVFERCRNLTEVITDRFTAIGTGMFANCTALTSITIKTPTVGNNAFENCQYLTTVTFANPDSGAVQFYIGEKAFYRCANLTTVDFGGCNIRSIGSQAFADTGLSSITIPEGLISVGNDVFVGSNITTIELNDNFKIEDLQSFGFIFNKVNVTLPENSSNYVIVNGGIYTKDMKTLVKAISVDESGAFAIDSRASAIAPYAFAGTAVKEITIPASITAMGEGAFKDSSLADITFAGGSTLSSLPAYAFYGTKITEISLPDSVKSIGDYAFASSALTAIDFKGTALGDGVFSNCRSLAEITLYDGIVQMGSYTFSGCSALVSVVMPSVSSLGAFTFENTPLLRSVTFGENASTVGRYTFYSANAVNRQQLTTVVLGSKTHSIGAYAFANCANLAEIDLKNVTSVGDYAFYGCTSLSAVTNLDKVERFGILSFCNCNGLTALNLLSATDIGIGAFAIDTGAAYTSVAIPSAVSIGAMAFLGGGESAVALPASTVEIGYAAFGSSENLASFTVDAANACYFAENGVLYRYISSEEYELVAYPTAKVAPEQEGKKVYEIKENTLAVFDSAFAYLNEDTIDRVVLPYSVNVIGDEAFYSSGIKEYVFNSIAAPTLQSSYREDIVNAILNTGNSYKGLFYANFEEEFVLYSEYFNQQSALVMYYPENGTGYNNYVYTRYFGTAYTTGIHMNDETRECKEAIESLYGVDVVKGWNSLPVNEENTAMVLAFSAQVQNARRLLDNVKDAAQLAFIGDENVAKLSAVEMALREVKAHFNIAVSVTRLDYDESSYKSNYVEGETFDMTGLKITVIYDDGSTMEADPAELTLKTTEPLTVYDRTVTIQGYGKEIRLLVNVVSVSNLTYDENSYKRDYKEGEVFDITGLKVTVVYADGSTIEADINLLTVLNSAPLSRGDTSVTISGYGKEINLPINVKGADEENPGTGCQSCSSSGSAFVSVFAAFAVLAVAFVIRKRNHS